MTIHNHFSQQHIKKKQKNKTKTKKRNKTLKFPISKRNYIYLNVKYESRKMGTRLPVIPYMFTRFF